MKNINILHKIKGRFPDFQDLYLPLLKFVPWFKAPTQDKRIVCKVTDDTMGFLVSFL